MKNRCMLLMSILSLSFFLGGCGEDAELTKFKNDMDNYCSQIAEIDNGINSIDSQSETAKDELLQYLGQLDTSFQGLASMDVPDEFSYIEELAADASEYMTEAVSLYEDAYSSNSYNEYTAAYAKEYYERACLRLNYIITFLHGEVPEDPNITILEEDTTSP